MAFDIQDDSFFDMDADSGAQKLETYGIWIKKEPEDVIDTEENKTQNADDTEDAFSFMDKTEEPRDNAPDMSLTEEVSGNEFGLEESSDADWEPDFSATAIPVDTGAPAAQAQPNTPKAETAVLETTGFASNSPTQVDENYIVSEEFSLNETAADFTEQMPLPESFGTDTTDEASLKGEAQNASDAQPAEESLNDASSASADTDDAFTEEPVVFDASTLLDESSFTDNKINADEATTELSTQTDEDLSNGDDSAADTPFMVDDSSFMEDSKEETAQTKELHDKSLNEDTANGDFDSDFATSFTDTPDETFDVLDDLDNFDSASDLASSIDENYPLDETSDSVNSVEDTQNESFGDVFDSSADSNITDESFDVSSKDDSLQSVLDDFDDVFSPTNDAAFVNTDAQNEEQSLDDSFTAEAPNDMPITEDTAFDDESAFQNSKTADEESPVDENKTEEPFNFDTQFDSDETDFTVDTMPKLDDDFDLPSFDDIAEPEETVADDEAAPILDLTEESLASAAASDTDLQNSAEEAFTDEAANESATLGETADLTGFAADTENGTDFAKNADTFIDTTDAGGADKQDDSAESQGITESDAASVTDAFSADESDASDAFTEETVPTIENIASIESTDPFTVADESTVVPTVEAALSGSADAFDVADDTALQEDASLLQDAQAEESEVATDTDASAFTKGIAVGAGVMGIAAAATALSLGKDKESEQHAASAIEDTVQQNTATDPLSEAEDGEISLDSFLGDSDDVSSEFGISTDGNFESGGDDFGDDFLSELNAEFSGEKEENSDLVEEKPIDIDLEFDDQYINEIQTDASDHIEETDDFSDVLSNESETVEDNFDDIFGNIVDETDTSAQKPADVLSDSVTGGFDEVDEFNDILNSVNAPSIETEVKQEQKPQKKIDYDITVETDEADTHKAPTMELSTEYDTNESIPLFASKEKNNVNKQLEITEKQEYTEIQEDEHNMNFDEITQAEDTVYESNDSKAILKEISGELAMLRSEISALKAELNKYKAQGAFAAQAEEPVTEPEASIEDDTQEDDIGIELPEPNVDTSSSSGFFDGDVEDETIALSGDELTNILNSADFTEEFVDNTEDIAAANGIDFDEKLEEPNLDDVQLPDSNFDDGTSVPGDEAASTDETASADAMPDEIPLPIEDNADETDQIEDSFIDKTEPITADSLSNDTINYLEEESTEETPLDLPEIEESDFGAEAPSEVSAEDESGNIFETPVVPETQESDGFDDVIGSATQEDELPEFDTIGDEGEIESIDTSPLETELNLSEEESPLTVPEEMPLGDGRDTLEEDSLDTDSPFAEPDDTPSEAVFESDQWQDEDVSSDEGTPIIDEASEVPIDADVATEEPNSMLGKASQLIADKEGTGDLKDEIKSVLVYMDQLLENLPEEKIEEFAKSEYFETYKKLFKELGLS